MGQYTAGWVVYGFAAPEGLSAQDMEEALDKERWPDVGFVEAGPYDESETAYVVTFAESGTTREATRFKLPAQRTVNAWNAQLADVAKENEWPRPDPQWLVFADVS